MWRAATTFVKAATASVILRRPAGALVIAALTAAALLWAGLPAPAEAQSTETGVSGVTVGGNPGYQIRSTDWVAGVSAATTQATVVVTPVDDDATVHFTDSDADSSTAGHQVNLSAGRNSFDVNVRAEDGIHSEEHYLFIYRAIDGVFGFRFDGSLSGSYEAGHRGFGSGMWSDGETIWAVDADDDKLYAYQLDGGTHDSAKDFNTLSAAGNQDPTGIWSDGETMWVADSEDDKLYAYRMSDRSRIPSRDIETLAEAGNLDPEGLWSDGRTIWVADSGDDKLYAYWLASGKRRPDGDFNTLRAAGNGLPSGIWSDGVTMWVGNLVDAKLYAYRMSDRAHDSDKDFNSVNDLQNGAAAIWSDGETMWVVDFDGFALAYNLTVSGELDLGSITFNGAAVSGVSADQRSYTLSETVPLTADVTIAATATATDSSVDYSYPDVISGTTGHQIALDEGDNAIQIHVRGLATYRTYELNVTAGDAPQGSTSRARLQVDEDDDGATHQFRGAIEGSEDARDIDWINVTLEADRLYAIVLKGGRYGDTDRTLHVPFVGGVLSMGVLKDGTDALGVYVSSGIEGRARVLFKPTTAGDYQVVVAGALVDQTGIYDLRVRPYEDDHYPNGIETGSTISFPTDSSLAHYPSAAVTGRINYEFDDDWFQASGLAPGRSYVIEARHGDGDEPRRGRRYLFVEVYDAEGDKVEVEPDLNRYIFTPQSAQDYYIRVYSHRRDRSRYTLYLHPTLSLTGNTLVGDSLSVDPADIYDPDGTSRVTRNDSWRYTWRRTDASGNMEQIRGARGSSYQLTDGDLGHTITGRVCYKADGSVRVYDCRYYSRSQPVRAVHTVPSDWARVPSGLDGGDRFRLLLVSEDKRTATETDIAAYNTWAQGQVTGGHADIQEYADHFAVLGSTSAVSARANTGTDFTDDNQGIPIYWLGGQKAADHYDDFWDGSWDHRNPGTLSDGSSITFTESDFIWTGTSRSGYEETDSDNGNVSRVGLGNSSVMLGQPYLLSIRVLSYTATRATGQYRMYILSHPFQVEESTATQQGNQPATGRPVISGAHNVGDTVTADVTGIADADGLTGVAFSYQWLSGDSELTGETNSSYTLASTDFGQAVAVRVTFTDDAGNEEVLTSEGIYPIMTARENTPASGQPTITGTAQVQQTLQASTTQIADADGLTNATYAYQWLSGGDPIADATGDTYTLTAAEQGQAITVRVRFSDDAGNEETLTSAPTAAVELEPNQPATGQPRVQGSALVGARLSVDTSAIADADGLTGAQYRYQWLTSEDGADTEIAGATGSSYRLTWREDGKSIKVRVSFRDDGGNEESLTSPALHPIRPTELRATVSGQTIVLNWEAANGFALLFDYRILREAPELGENAPVVSTDTGNSATSYTDSDVEPGVLYRYRVQAANYWNQLSPASEAVEIRMPEAEPAANTPATGLPTISGIPQVGQTLTANVTAIADQDGLDNAAYAYQWLADNAAITGATAAIYTLTSSEQGKTVNVAVTFTDDAGNAESLTSAATTTIAPLPLTGFSLVDTSDQSVAATLAGGDRIVLDDPANGSYGIRADIAPGATLESMRLELTGSATAARTENVAPYSLHGDDGDDLNGRALPPGSYTLRATAYLEDDLGGDAIQVLEVSFNIMKANTPATGRPAITGAVRVGETLYADVTGISDADGLDNVSYGYQWIRNDGSADSNITGAIGSTYELSDADQGKTVKVRVSFTDDGGNDETLASDATGDVAAAPNRAATGTPTITGTVQVDETLTADTSGIADEDGLDNATFSYQWVAGGTDIDGATGSSYTLADNDAGKTVQVRVSFTDEAGNDETLTSAATGAVAAAPSPLTVRLTAAAPVHDGSTAFTFEIRFSEEPAPDFSYKTLRDHAFTVAGGSVKTAQRLQKDPISNIGWRVTVEPGGNGEVTIILPATADCEAVGAICTEDGRMLFNRIELTVAGPAG